MREFVTSSDMAKLLGVPDDCVAVNVRLRPGKPVTVTTMSYLKKSEKGGTSLVAKSFFLIEHSENDKKG